MTQTSVRKHLATLVGFLLAIAGLSVVATNANAQPDALTDMQSIDVKFTPFTGDDALPRERWGEYNIYLWEDGPDGKATNTRVANFDTPKPGATELTATIDKITTKTNFIVRQSVQGNDWAWQTRPDITAITPGSLLSISATSTANTDGTSNSTHKATPLVELDGIPAPQVDYRADGTTVTLPDAHGVIYYKDDAKTVKAEKVENLAPGEKLKLTAAPELGYRFKFKTFSYEDQVRTIQAPVTPQKPGFDPKTGELTITDQTGVEYTIADQKAVSQKVAPGASVTVQAKPAADYVFATGADKEWTFTADKATKPLELTVHYKRTDGAYEGWMLHSWLEPGDQAQRVNFDGKDPSTAFRSFEDITGAEKIGMIVFSTPNSPDQWVKNTGDNIYFQPSQIEDGKIEVWIRQGDPKVYYSTDEVKAATPKPADDVKQSEWQDVPGTEDIQSKTVQQKATKTVTPFEWNAEKLEWVAGTPVDSEVSQTRDMTDQEVADRTVTPQKPGFDPKTGELTITDQTGVEYTIADQKAVSQKVAPGASVTVQAKPAAGYVFATGADKEWTFTADKATKPLELTVHYKRTDGAYDGYKLHSWLRKGAGDQKVDFDAKAVAFDGQDPTTATRTFTDVTDAEKLGVIVYKLADNGKDWIKNTEPDVFVDLAQAKDGKLEIWIRQSDPKVYYSLQDMKDRVTKPESKEVAGEWADVAFNLDIRKVSQERSVTTTEYVWSDETWSYEPVASTKRETRTRDLTEAEANARTLLPGTTVAPGEWTDVSFDVAKREVTQERDVLTTKYAWSSEKWTYVPTSTTSKETQTRPMTSDEAKDRTPKPADSVQPGEWTVTSMDKEAKTVTESRDVTTTPYVWDSDAFAWKESPKDAKVTTETRTRPMTPEEIDAITPKPEPEPTPGKTSGTVDNTTTPDYSQVEGVKVVSPNAPIFPDASDSASCTVKPFVTIVPMKGVSYSVTVDGKAIAWVEDNPSHFEYDYGKTVTVKAKALEGYQLAKGAKTEWSWTAPTREALKCTNPAIPLEPANPAKPGPGEKPTDNPSVDKESQKLDDALKAIIEQALKELQYNTGKDAQSDTGTASTVVVEKAASAKAQKPLAHTGATVVGLSVAAMILLLAGGAIAVIRRRR